MTEGAPSAGQAGRPGDGPAASGGPGGRRPAAVYDLLVRHWWNNSWGRLNRRDVYVHTDGRTFQLELRLGGAEGRRARRPFDTLDEAITEAAQHMAPDQNWVDITGTHTRGTGPNRVGTPRPLTADPSPRPPGHDEATGGSSSPEG